MDPVVLVIGFVCLLAAVLWARNEDRKDMGK